LISKNDLEPRGLDEQIISRIGGLSKADIAKEVWGAEPKDVKSELNKLVDIHKGGNKTINQLAEEIAGESLGTSWETDSSHVRNTIISALQSASTSNDILQYVQKSRI
jgi:flagellar biosynthesis/type III secretory pathway protein FliH